MFLGCRTKVDADLSLIEYLDRLEERMIEVAEIMAGPRENFENI